MRLKTKRYAKLAVISLIAAFSFGLAISCVSNHKQNINKVFAADDISTTWSYNSNTKALSCTYASNYPNGFVWETNQVSVTGLGNGQYELVYNVLGYPSGSVEPELTDYGNFTLTFTSGYYDPTTSTDAPYGSITASPVDIDGLDSGTEYEIYLKVEPTGDMNQRPEPPDIESLEWGFDDSNYYYTTSYNDQQFYNFNLKATPTGISYTYYAISKELYVECELEAIDSTSPYEFSTYTFIYSVNEENVSVNDGKWTFTDAYNTNTKVTETVVFPENDVVILGWVYHDGLMYVYNAHETADITLTHIVYHNEPSTATANNNYVYLYYDVSYNGDFLRSDVITIQDEQGDEISISPSDQATAIDSITVKEFTGAISGPSTSVYPENSIISVSCNATPYSYRGNFWSYDDYSGELFYCDREQCPGEVATLTNVDVGDTTTTLTYSSAHLEKEIVVSGTPSGTTLEGMVTLEENDVADFQVRLTIPKNYDFGWNYDSTDHSLVYYDEDFGGVYSMTEAVNNVADKVITLTYSGRSSTSGTEDIQTIELDYSSVGGYDDSENTVSGYALLDGSNEYITVLLNVDLLEANTWVYIDGRMYWKDINSSNIDTNYLDIKKFVYVTCEDNVDNEYAEIDYTYTNDGTTTNLPTLTLNGASNSPDGDIYYVRGLYYGREVEIEIPVSKWKTREYGTYDYEVIFDGNGATSGSMATDEFNITEYSFDYVLPDCSYKREGYKFTGWGFQPETVIKFQPGTTRSITNGTTIFYAQWEVGSDETPTTFKISFNPNGGIGYMEPLTVEAGRNQVPECGFTRPGYIFDCWAVGSADSSIKVNAGSYVSVDGNYDLYALWLPGVEAETPISTETITNITTVIGSSDLDLSDAQQNQIKEYFKEENRGYVSEEAGTIVYEALSNTSIDKSDEDIAAAQQDLVVTVVVTGFAVDSTKASSISGAQEIDKALPENANFSVESEIDEFYQRQMYELFGGEQPSRSRKISRATGSEYEIDTDVSGMEKDEALDYLESEQSLYENMVDYVDTGVEHMGKAALKLRVCSGESVTVQVKSYVTDVKVSSYREFDKAAADKEFVEAVYKAILLSMQHEVISILESEHKPSNNAEKEAQYQKELDAVKDLETFEIMVTEVLRQKYVELTGEQIGDVDDFKPIYWEIFSAWALDQPSPYNISLEELTQTTIEQSKNRAGTFIVHSDLSKAEWGFIAGIVGGAALLISAAAVIPTVLSKKRKKEGRE